jgi:hypothetical protein
MCIEGFANLLKLLILFVKIVPMLLTSFKQTFPTSHSAVAHQRKTHAHVAWHFKGVGFIISYQIGSECTDNKLMERHLK